MSTFKFIEDRLAFLSPTALEELRASKVPQRERSSLINPRTGEGFLKDTPQTRKQRKREAFEISLANISELYPDKKLTDRRRMAWFEANKLLRRWEAEGRA